MTRWMHPPELLRARERDQFDPVVEGGRYGLPRGLALAIWGRVCADATDSAGRRDEDQAQRRFHELAARIAARGGRIRPEVGRITRVGVELDGAPPLASGGDELKPRTPGRETLVAVEARRWAQRLGEPAVGEVDRHHEPTSTSRAIRSMTFPTQVGHPEAMRRTAILYTQSRSLGLKAGDVASHRAMAFSVDVAGHVAEEDLAKLSEASGSPLVPALRTRMEALFEHPFAHVRIHTDGAAAQAADTAGALAVTLGSHIYFNRDQFAPDSVAGNRLLLHELAQVVQHDEGRLLNLNGTTSDAADFRATVVQCGPGTTAQGQTSRQEKNKTIKTLAWNTQEAHARWKHLNEKDRRRLVDTMAGLWGRDYANEFERLARTPGYKVPGDVPETALTEDQLYRLGYRKVYGSFLENWHNSSSFWLNPAGQMLHQKDLSKPNDAEYARRLAQACVLQYQEAYKFTDRLDDALDSADRDEYLKLRDYLRDRYLVINENAHRSIEELIDRRYDTTRPLSTEDAQVFDRAIEMIRGLDHEDYVIYEYVSPERPLGPPPPPRNSL